MMIAQGDQELSSTKNHRVSYNTFIGVPEMVQDWLTSVSSLIGGKAVSQ